MRSDHEIYELAKKDKRAFLPGSHATRATALRVLLADGWSVKWEDRSNGDRPRCGFATLSRADGERMDDGTDELARALKVKDAEHAWALLTRAPELDPAFLGSLQGRLVERAPDGKLLAQAAPRTIASALALATAPSVMRDAEELVRSAFVRAAPFGIGACPAIVWRSESERRLRAQSRDRSAFSPLHAPIIDALGYGAWSSCSHPGQRLFSFSSIELDIPATLVWTARDMGEAMQLDAGREKDVRTPSGARYAELESPFEPLLRVAYSGMLVEKITADQVVLVAIER